MTHNGPTVTILAGPNGSGKTTTAASLLRDYFNVVEFVNADTIAQGLSAFSVESVAIAAGRIMLARLRELAAQHVSFAFETTLSARSFAPWLRQLQTNGYHFHLFFLWLPTPELAISRVANRVQQGGHSIPTDVIRRRYDAGLSNFFQIYQPLADMWTLGDNSDYGGFQLIASQLRPQPIEIFNPTLWNSIREKAA